MPGHKNKSANQSMMQTREINEGPRRSRSHRRRGEKKPQVSSSQLVVYSPNAKSSPSSPLPKTPSRHRQRVSHHEPHQGGGGLGGLKIRTGDVRKTYKVLPIVIGTGSFGTVRSCIDRESRTKLAIKTIAIKGKTTNPTLLKNEIALLQQIHHKNVVGVVDVIQDRYYIHIIMEQCRGGDLFDMTVDGKTRLSEGRIRKIVKSLLAAIAYLHEMNIVHRDLKAEHLMFSTNNIKSPIKIIDFGVATLHKPGDNPMTAFTGSARSMAPEVIKRSYGKECDLWSCGIITYFLLMQRMPFDSQSGDPNEIMAKITSGRFGYPQWAATGVSEEAKDFIDCLLVVDPRKRLTAKQALSHPWISKKKTKKKQEKQHSRPQAKPLVIMPEVSNNSRRRRH